MSLLDVARGLQSKQETQEKTLMCPLLTVSSTILYQYSMHLCYEFFIHASLLKDTAPYSGAKASDELKVRLSEYILSR